MECVAIFVVREITVEEDGNIAKLHNDKYYTSPELARYCVEKTKKIIDTKNITEYIEPSAGAGVFLDYLDKPYLAYDIEPEDDRIVKADWLAVELSYKKGRCVIGNPPYGRCLNLAQKFYKQSVKIADYIAFILPISQLKNTRSMYEFDLIHSEDLGKRIYTNKELHCCFNIYKKPGNSILNFKPISKLRDISICRQDSKDYQNFDYDIRMCYWGDGTAGKILQEDEHYSAEYKIKVNNPLLKDKVKAILNEIDWKEYLNCIAMRKIQQFHIIDILTKAIPEIQ